MDLCRKLKLTSAHIYIDSDGVHEIEERKERKSQSAFSWFVYLLFRNFICHPSEECNKEKEKKRKEICFLACYRSYINIKKKKVREKYIGLYQMTSLFSFTDLKEA